MNNTNTKIIKVHGKNIDIFFQNIITNDINDLNVENPLYTAMLSPQGKYLYDFIILKEKNFFLLEANTNVVNSLIDEIKRYDIRNDISLELQENFITKVIIKENLTKNYIEKIKKRRVYKEESFLFFLDPRSKDFLYRFWLNNTSTNLLNFSEALEVEKKRILNKIPNSELDLTYNKSFILNYNFENINALSFNKGCYIGQENTARQKFRGTQKYSLKSIKVISGTMPDLNEDIFYKKVKIGTMKSSCNDIGLCLIRKDAAKNNADLLKTDKNCILKIL
jgi:folate-binding protein YgfZ